MTKNGLIALLFPYVNTNSNSNLIETPHTGYRAAINTFSVFSVYFGLFGKDAKEPVQSWIFRCVSLVSLASSGVVRHSHPGLCTVLQSCLACQSGWLQGPLGVCIWGERRESFRWFAMGSNTCLLDLYCLCFVVC